MLQLLRVRDRFQRPYHRLLKKPKVRGRRAAPAAEWVADQQAAAPAPAGEAAAGEAAAGEAAAGEAAAAGPAPSGSTSGTSSSGSSGGGSGGAQGQLSDEQLGAVISGAFSPGALSGQQLAALVSLERELQARGRFLPLMAIFPYDAAQHKWQVPWGEADMAARTWLGLRRSHLEETGWGA
jgi:hypothetical protein